MFHSTSLTVIIIFSLVITGQCLLECKDPPAKSQTFFNLEHLLSLSTKYPEEIQTPITCTPETEAIRCAKQICCDDKIGCCYKDPVTNRQMCGCKSKTDGEVCYGPPVAYVSTCRCEEHNSVESYTCIQQTDEGDTVDANVMTWIEAVTRMDALQATGETAGQIVNNVKKTTRTVLRANGFRPRNLINGFSTDKLIEMIYTDKLYELAQKVMTMHEKGLSYGLEREN